MEGKTVRACDSCMRRRARWYCAADDAFLCQGCDSSVHSANQLASRHERVKLQSASTKFITTNGEDAPPAWHQGFTRKARTPRQNREKSSLMLQKDAVEKALNPLDPLVPEIGSEDGSVDESEDQQFCRVPVFDPFNDEFDNMVGSEGNEAAAMETKDGNMMFESYGQEGASELDSLHGFLPSDMDLAAFAADVESLLGGGTPEDDGCEIKGIELLDCKEEEYSNIIDINTNVCIEDKVTAKVKDEEAAMEAPTACGFSPALDMLREPSNWNFDYESPAIGEEEGAKPAPVMEPAEVMNGESKEEIRRNIFLRLNYESVITAWAGQRSPWTNGSRPEVNSDDAWPDFMSIYPLDPHYPGGGMGGGYGQGRGSDGEREARVLRYREKRRTRLFAKKIRYEVRKLNAEKRPRMKGRFVKRTSFVGTSFPYINQ